jgi:hypothetical protein
MLLSRFTQIWSQPETPEIVNRLQWNAGVLNNMDPYQLFLQQSRSFRKLQLLDSTRDCSTKAAPGLFCDALPNKPQPTPTTYDARRQCSTNSQCFKRAASARQPGLLKTGPYAAAVRRRHSEGSLPQLAPRSTAVYIQSASSKQHRSRRRIQELEPLQPIDLNMNLTSEHSVFDFGNISVASVRAAYKQSRMQDAAEQERRRLHVMRRRSTGSDTGLSSGSCFSNSVTVQHVYDDSSLHTAAGSEYAAAWQQVAAAEHAAEQQPPAVDHVFDGLVYSAVCMNDTGMWELLQSVKRRLRQGQTLRLACDLAANSSDNAACRQMLSMVYIKSAQHCADPSIPAIREHAGQLYLTMQPAARYTARAQGAVMSAANAAAQSKGS